MNETSPITIGGIIHAASPIYYPEGYAKQVFDTYLEDVTYSAEGNKLYFKLDKKIVLRSVKKWMQYLVGDSTNVTWMCYNDAGNKVIIV